MTRPVVLIAEELSPATVEALGPDFEIRHCDGSDRAELLAAIGDVEPNVNVTLPPGRDPSGPGHDMWLDIGRLQKDTGYRPEYCAERAVADYLAWLKAGNDR